MSTESSTQKLLKGKLTDENRYGEAGPLPHRSKRFYYNGKEWFFQARKNQRHGPYASFKEAEKALVLYLKRCGIVRYVPDT